MKTQETTFLPGRPASAPGRAMRALLALALIFAGAAVATAQTEGAISTDESDLFGSADDIFSGEPLVTEIEETDSDIASILLTSDAVQIGGRYSFGMNATFGWDDISTVGENFTDPDINSLSTPLSTQLFFDGRPDEDFRVFGKMTVSYPFSTDPDDPADPVDPVRDLEDVFHVDELFSDFNWSDTVFFRGGKQTMNWGVGYFYSPADLLSISEIDPEDPDAEREGPVALKANIPSGSNNWYLYAIPAFADELLDTGVALKYEMVLGGAEVALGGIYQRDIAPAIMTTVSTSIWKFDLFAEGVASYGSNRTYVQESAVSPLGVETYLRSDEFILSATAGGRYTYSPEESDSSLMILAQYLYNGDGYAEPGIISDNQAGVMALIGNGDLGFADIQNRGTHYSALQVSWTDILGTDVTGGLFWMQGYSDMSGRIVPSLSRSFFDNVSVSVQTPISLGDAGDEFAPTGNALAVNLGISIGGGSF